MKRPNNPATGWVIAFFVIALLGFADAGYLTVEHYRNVIPPCTTGGCQVVLTSAYSTLFGIPDSLGGMFYYFLIALGIFIYIEARYVSKNVSAFHSALLAWTLRATIIGFLVSAWLFYLQAAVIHSFCQYCLGSAGTSTLLLIIALIILSKNERDPLTIHENI